MNAIREWLGVVGTRYGVLQRHRVLMSAAGLVVAVGVGVGLALGLGWLIVLQVVVVVAMLGMIPEVWPRIRGKRVEEQAVMTLADSSLPPGWVFAGPEDKGKFGKTDVDCVLISPQGTRVAVEIKSFNVFYDDHGSGPVLDLRKRPDLGPQLWRLRQRAAHVVVWIPGEKRSYGCVCSVRLENGTSFAVLLVRGGVEKLREELGRCQWFVGGSRLS